MAGCVMFPVERTSSLRDRYGLKAMVETGTTYGRTAVQCAGLFDKVYTIELNPHLYQRARRMCAGFPNVEVIFGNSIHVLPLLIPRLDGPALFWLDAHWTGDKHPKLGPECPLLGELCLIGQSHRRHVLLIDDARLFAEGPPPPHVASEWPTMAEIVAAVAEWPVRMNVEVQGDTIQVTPA